MEPQVKIYDSFIVHQVIKSVDDSNMPKWMKNLYHIFILFRIFFIPLTILIILYLLLIRLT